jgi:hypothetical protein
VPFASSPIKSAARFSGETFNRASMPENGNSDRRKNPPSLIAAVGRSAWQAGFRSVAIRPGRQFRPENDKPVYLSVFPECIEDLRCVNSG